MPPQPQPPSPQAAFFLGAPATKLMAMGSVAAYLIIHHRHAQSVLELNTDRAGDFYRFVSSKITFGTTSELVVGLSLLVFLLARLEREMGTRHCLTMLTAVNLLSIVEEWLLMDILAVDYRYLGPYPLLGAGFWYFHRYQPRLHPHFISILGLSFSEKAFYYLWFLQLAIRDTGTRLATIEGILAAMLYQTLLSDFAVPDRIVSLVYTTIGQRLLDDPPRILVPDLGGGHRPARGSGLATHPVFGQQRPDGAPRQVAEAQQRPVEPDAAAVEQLMLMGFEENAVREALRLANNNVERAADRLLTA